MSEHNEQSAYFDWLQIMSNRHEQLNWIFAVPNGGKRHIGTAKKLKKEGVKSGVPDIFIPIPSDGYHGLWIEMKYGKNTLSSNQIDWMNYLISAGYRHVTCWSADEAINITKEYLHI